jgi:eukaryotic-like serine/threonine-protein kinase
MTEDFKPLTVGRYLLHRKIARGGMATIHIARLMGDVGFSRIVAAKRMHPELAEDSEFVAMFLDEARIASKVQHRNVVNVLDVVTLGEEVMLVQEYVHGAPLSVLLRAAYESKAPVPVPVAAAIACQILAGLHAAHETRDEMGQPLHIVHRDVSPQNIMIGTDGAARLLDFGVAKAAMGAHVSRKGTFKGKLGYSAPEQIRGEASKSSDIYSLGVVFWELLVGHRLHNRAQGEAELIAEILAGKLPTITEELAPDKNFIGPYRWRELESIEPVIRKALDVNAKRRWETAADMEEAIVAAVPVASSADITAWLRAVGKQFLDEREQMIAEEEASWRRTNGGITTVTSRPMRLQTTPATEPSVMPPAPDTSWFRRAPTAFIAALVVVLIGMVTFLVRDLNGTVTPAPAATAPRMYPVTARAMPLEAPLDRNEPARTSQELTSEASPAGEDGTEPAATSVATAMPSTEPAASAPAMRTIRPAAKPAPPRARIVRAAPAPRPPPAPAPVAAPPAAPPKPAAAALDCSTPFYFEGHKKIFKPGCL